MFDYTIFTIFLQTFSTLQKFNKKKRSKPLVSLRFEGNRKSKPCVIGSVGFPVLALRVTAKAVSF